MKTLFILNDAPYGTERSYNGLRLAGALAKCEGEQIKVFLIGDAVSCSKAGQKLPQGYYNIEMMLKSVARNNGEIGACSTCMDARGMTDDGMIDGTRRSTLDELSTWTAWADKVITF
jgi:uncharacterized protein involved in oxidation of intracellular sulfur